MHKLGVKDVSRFRLPENIFPSLYQLTVKVYLGKSYGNLSFTHEGNVSILLECRIPTNRIIMHSKDLTIDEKSLAINSTGDRRIGLADKKFALDVANDFFIVNLSRNCSINQFYTISVSYKGALQKDPMGFFRDMYLDSTGAEH